MLKDCCSTRETEESQVILGFFRRNIADVRHAYLAPYTASEVTVRSRRMRGTHGTAFNAAMTLGVKLKRYVMLRPLRKKFSGV